MQTQQNSELNDPALFEEMEQFKEDIRFNLSHVKHELLQLSAIISENGKVGRKRNSKTQRARLCDRSRDAYCKKLKCQCKRRINKRSGRLEDNKKLKNDFLDIMEEEKQKSGESSKSQIVGRQCSGGKSYMKDTCCNNIVMKLQKREQIGSKVDLKDSVSKLLALAVPANKEIMNPKECQPRFNLTNDCGIFSWLLLKNQGTSQFPLFKEMRDNIVERMNKDSTQSIQQKKNVIKSLKHLLTSLTMENETEISNSNNSEKETEIKDETLATATSLVNDVNESVKNTTNEFPKETDCEAQIIPEINSIEKNDTLEMYNSVVDQLQEVMEERDNLRVYINQLIVHLTNMGVVPVVNAEGQLVAFQVFPSALKTCQHHTTPFPLPDHLNGEGYNRWKNGNLRMGSVDTGELDELRSEINELREKINRKENSAGTTVTQNNEEVNNTTGKCDKDLRSSDRDTNGIQGTTPKLFTQTDGVSPTQNRCPQQRTYYNNNQGSLMFNNLDASGTNEGPRIKYPTGALPFDFNYNYPLVPNYRQMFQKHQGFQAGPVYYPPNGYGFRYQDRRRFKQRAGFEIQPKEEKNRSTYDVTSRPRNEKSHDRKQENAKDNFTCLPTNNEINYNYQWPSLNPAETTTGVPVYRAASNYVDNNESSPDHEGGRSRDPEGGAKYKKNKTAFGGNGNNAFKKNKKNIKSQCIGDGMKRNGLGNESSAAACTQIDKDAR